MEMCQTIYFSYIDRNSTQIKHSLLICLIASNNAMYLVRKSFSFHFISTQFNFLLYLLCSTHSDFRLLQSLWITFVEFPTIGTSTVVKNDIRCMINGLYGRLWKSFFFTSFSLSHLAFYVVTEYMQKKSITHLVTFVPQIGNWKVKLQHCFFCSIHFNIVMTLTSLLSKKTKLVG